MIQTDFDISTRVMFADTTGQIIYNRCKKGAEIVAVEWSDGTISLMNVNELSVKYGSEEWVSVRELGKRRGK